jgi:hypothetical protein
LVSAWEPLDIGSDALADRAVWFEQQLVSVGVASWGTSDIQSPEDSSMHTAILTSVLEDRKLTSGLLCLAFGLFWIRRWVQSTQIEEPISWISSKDHSCIFCIPVPRLILLAFQIDSFLVAGGTVLAFFLT